MKTLIKNGRVIDPSQNIDAIMDLLVEDGVVKEVAAEIKAAADEVYDADGLIVAPGLVDVHTHLREPGLEAKEDGCGSRRGYDYRLHAEYQTRY